MRPWAAVVVWLIVVCAGFGVLWAYAGGRGGDSRAPGRWPGDSALARATDRATLLMFVHPRCPCTRASLAELNRLVQRVRGKVRPTVVFVRPNGTAEEWARTDLRQIAANVPDVTLFDDGGGVEARRFGAVTSGASLLYDAGGALAFSGGLTQVRGHEGSSFGQERIVALLGAGGADRRDSPVFGCALDDDAPKETTP